MGMKLDFYKAALRNKANKGFLGYPMASIAFYGPDNRRANKIAVGIIQGEDEEPSEMNRWHIDKGDIRRDGAVIEAVYRFVQSREVRSIAMMEEILGCPHEEGKDYPDGEDCPECPYWAGRKRPLDREDPGDRAASILRSMERDRAKLGKGDSASTDLERAQDLMWDAWDERVRSKRIAMARRALEISPDCADAYVLLAGETARNPEEALDLYQKGIAAGERALGKKPFEENVGHFWGILETRPYMRARNGLAECLREMGRTSEAIEHFKELLLLNPTDNQGNRDLLLACYLDVGRDSDAWDLLNQYPAQILAAWAYSSALVLFRLHGDSQEARDALKKAVEQNPHALKYLSGRRRLPRELPSTYQIGNVNEAVIYAASYEKYWRETPGAVAWLQGGTDSR
jgi:tetratricopeptide (TPR) repeat protein